MMLAHAIRLDPTPRQEAYFRNAAGAARWAYNQALEMWNASYAAGEKPQARALRKRFTATRRTAYPWTLDVSSAAVYRPFDNLQAAFEKFFTGKARYPRFKKRGRSADCFYVGNQENTCLSIEAARARIPRLGWVRTREALRHAGRVVGASVRRRADAWFLVVQVEVGTVHRQRTADGSVGVDLGLKSSATLSTGTAIQGPRALQSNLRRLERLSRAHARRVKGGANRAKAVRALARLHWRIECIRTDFLHKLTTKLCRENQAVGIEDLRVAGMVRNRRLSRRISDESWGEFRRQLEYKAPLYGTDLVVHDRFYPSSKACSACGNIKNAMPLGERIYRCECGLVLDRDLNAARNLEPKTTRGPRGIDACGHGGSGRPLRGDATAVVEAGIGQPLAVEAAV